MQRARMRYFCFGDRSDVYAKLGSPFGHNREAFCMARDVSSALTPLGSSDVRMPPNRRAG
jgi:hypothetical protein